MSTMFALLLLLAASLTSAQPRFNRPGSKYRPYVLSVRSGNQPPVYQEDLNQIAEQKRQYQAAFASLASRTAAQNNLVQPAKALYQPQGQQFQPAEALYQPQSQQFQPTKPFYQPQGQQFQPSKPLYQPQSQQFQPAKPLYQPQGQQFQPSKGLFQPQRQQFQPAEALYQSQGQTQSYAVPIFVPAKQQYSSQHRGTSLFQPISFMHHGAQNRYNQPTPTETVNVLPDGHLDDTDEVKAAKREHFAVVAKVKAAAAREEERRKLHAGPVRKFESM